MTRYQTLVTALYTAAAKGDTTVTIPLDVAGSAYSTIEAASKVALGDGGMEAYGDELLMAVRAMHREEP